MRGRSSCRFVLGEWYVLGWRQILWTAKGRVNDGSAGQATERWVPIAPRLEMKGRKGRGRYAR